MFAFVLASFVIATPEKLFSEFKAEFSKEYASAAEEAKAFKVFIKNLELIEELNAADPGATYSHLTPFADIDRDEFSSSHGLVGTPSPRAEAPLLPTSDLPTSYDWRDHGAVNAIKDQAQCGSCWAFSSVANVEGANFVANGKLVSLSEQELVDCEKTDHGCGGGLPEHAFEWMIKDKQGLELESSYGYKARDGSCKATKAKEVVSIANWTAISQDEDQIAAALIKYGPLSIGINAGPMQLYHGGVASPWKIFCSPSRIDHGVAIVGFGTDGGKKYWTIRNSWGTTWGEKGYYRIVRGKGACGLNTMVTTSIVAKKTDTMLI